MTGSTTPDFDSLTVDGAARAGSVQSVGTGTVTAGSVGSSNGVRLNPASAGTSPSIQALGPDTNVGIRFLKAGTGVFSFNGDIIGTSTRFQAASVIAWSGSNPVNATLAPISITSTLNGTSGLTDGSFAINRIDTTSNIVGQINAGHTGVSIVQQMGATTVGYGQAVQIVISDAATTGQFAAGGAFSLVGLSVVAVALHNQGGTLPAPSGFVFGDNCSASAKSGTFLRNVIGREYDVSAESGSKPGFKTAIAITHSSGDADQGTLGYDAAIMIADGFTGSAWNAAIAIGNNFSSPAVLAGGDVIKTSITGVNGGVGPNLTVQSLGWIVDAAESNQTLGFARAKGFVVESAGGVRSGKGYLRSTALGVALGADGFMAATATVASSSTGWITGGHAADTAGNVWTVTAPSGTVTSVALFSAVPNATAATPLALDMPAQPGLTLSLNVAYDTGTTIEINPGGGPIKTALLGNFANDAAAAAGGVVVGQLYRNGSIVMQRVA